MSKRDLRLMELHEAREAVQGALKSGSLSKWDRRDAEEALAEIEIQSRELGSR